VTKTAALMQNRLLKQLLVCIPPWLGDEKVYHRVAGMRQVRGMSQKDVEFPGCSAATLSRLEAGRNSVIDFRMLVGLSLKLKANPLYLGWGFMPQYLEPEMAEVLRQVLQADEDTLEELQRRVLTQVYPSLR
jgi:transcriptional regulator with XRE-family HTH domain